MKTKLIHLLFDPNYSADISKDKWDSVLEKQKKSIKSFEEIKFKFDTYTQIYSKVNRTELPIETCADPSIITNDMSTWDGGPVLSYGHYGAYMAHKKAIIDEFSNDYDIILIIEADSVTNLTPDEFYNKMVEVYNICEEKDVRLVSLAGPKFGYDVSELMEDWGDWLKVPHFLLGSGYFVHKKERESIQYKYRNTKWHTPDIWMFWNYNARVNIITSKEVLIDQCEGFSAIDEIKK